MDDVPTRKVNSRNELLICFVLLLTEELGKQLRPYALESSRFSSVLSYLEFNTHSIHGVQDGVVNQ
jgi:hypothetical protein